MKKKMLMFGTILCIGASLCGCRTKDEIAEDASGKLETLLTEMADTDYGDEDDEPDKNSVVIASGEGKDESNTTATATDTEEKDEGAKEEMHKNAQETCRNVTFYNMDCFEEDTFDMENIYFAVYDYIRKLGLNTGDIVSCTVDKDTATSEEKQIQVTMADGTVIDGLLYRKYHSFYAYSSKTIDDDVEDNGEWVEGEGY